MSWVYLIKQYKKMFTNKFWITEKPAGINQYCDGATYKCEPGLVCDMAANNLQVCSCPKTQHYVLVINW